MINKKTIIIQSPYETVSGYGAKSRDIIRSIIKWSEKNNFDVKLLPTPWGSCPRTALNNCDDRHLFDSRKLTQGTLPQPEIFAQISIPNESQPKGKYNILFTSGIETTLCKGDWIEGVNRMDLTIVPSRHAKSVFEFSKFKKVDKSKNMEIPIELGKPVEVLFEGSDTNIYNNSYTETHVSTVMNKVTEDFCFLFVGHWLQGDIGADRKDVGMLIRTFLETFKNKPNKPALVLKTNGANFSEMDKNEILRKISLCEKSVDSTDLPKIYLLHGELSDTEINSLYNHPKIKAHVSFTHGEGYGRPLQEATLSGKPVIAPNWSGHIDFLDPQLSISLTGELTPIHGSAVNEWIIKESKWFTTNYSSASFHLMDVFKNYKKHLSSAQQLMKINRKNKSLNAMDVELENIFNKYLPKFQESVTINLPKLNKISDIPSPQLPKLNLRPLS